MEVNRVYNGTCLEVLKGFPDNSIDSCVTDPPYGISFMNKHWDYDVPKVEVWKEIYRVLKPGAHVLCACGTRTQHRMAVNIEDAGFEIRDIISWLYGSGFPKSLNVALAIDKQNGSIGDRGKAFVTAGAGEREDIQNTSGAEAGTMTYSNAISDEAKQWQGYGTALKPAQELWTLARKPLSENTVAQNVLKHGTGGINLDGCRIEIPANDDNLRLNSPNHKFNEDGSDFKLHKGDGTRATQDLGFHNSLGRFPANVILDEFTGKILDEQTGILTSGHMDTVSQGKNYGIYGKYNGKEVYAEGDSGGASRFFKNCNFSDQDNFDYCHSCCTLHEANNSEKWQSKQNNVLNATKNLNTTLATATSIVPLNVMQKVSEKSVLLVKNVGNLCDLCATNFVHEVVKISSNSPELQAIQDFTTNSNKCSLLLNLVLCVEQMESIDTTQITTSLLKLFGSAYHAIENYIKKDTKVVGEQKLGQSRFAYIPKADNYERNKGLNNFKLGEPPASARSNAAEGRENALGRPRANHHPTVKPIDLMRYLVKLITPKKGICLDPYCGSGTTLIGCKMELINYIGIEREEEYCKIAEARVAAWNPDKYKPQELF